MIAIFYYVLCVSKNCNRGVILIFSFNKNSPIKATKYEFFAINEKFVEIIIEFL